MAGVAVGLLVSSAAAASDVEEAIRIIQQKVKEKIAQPGGPLGGPSTAFHGDEQPLTRVLPISVQRGRGDGYAVEGGLREIYLTEIVGRDKLRGNEYADCLRVKRDPFEEMTYQPEGKYDRFSAVVGVSDTEASTGEVVFQLLSGDEKLWESHPLRAGDQPEIVDVSIDKAFRLTLKASMESWNRVSAVWANPRVYKSDKIKTQPQGGTTPGGKPPSPGDDIAAPFAVDPRDLDKLAEGLRRKVDADPVVHERVERGYIAVATFSLIDIASSAVAKNVAEDLYTAMINDKFSLGERGQLDKVLQELKIHDTGLIDAKTAQRIGYQTGCDIILLGSISDRGQFVVINARLMETATGKSLVAERVEMRKIPIERGG